MSSEQITQETVPVEKTETSTETVKPTTPTAKQVAVKGADTPAPQTTETTTQ